MDYEMYTGNARLSSIANNKYTTSISRARFRWQYGRLACGDARESVAWYSLTKRIALARLFNQFLAVPSRLKSSHEWSEYTALDLRSAAVNAADWKISSATSRGPRKSRKNGIRFSYCETCSIWRGIMILKCIQFFNLSVILHFPFLSLTARYDNLLSNLYYPKIKCKWKLYLR